MGVNQLTRSFILLLADQAPPVRLTDIIASFDAAVWRRSAGDAPAEVTSARRASKDSEVEELKRVSKRSINPNPMIETHVFRPLLGGLIVKVGSR